ncbi:MAG: hypothetical protein M3121_03930 [Chloroflexota bacterium]|nr:hypothetical protein [Chloroflexota bacterium]
MLHPGCFGSAEDWDEAGYVSALSDQYRLIRIAALEPAHGVRVVDGSLGNHLRWNSLERGHQGLDDRVVVLLLPLRLSHEPNSVRL